VLIFKHVDIWTFDPIWALSPPTEMVVQTAINPKKASVSSNYSRKATIGKGVTTLDDFEDTTEVRVQPNPQRKNNYTAHSDNYVRIATHDILNILLVST